MQTLSVFLENAYPAHRAAFLSILDRLNHTLALEASLPYRVNQGKHFTVVSFGSAESPVARHTVRALIALAAAEWLMRVLEPEWMQELVPALVPDLQAEWTEIVAFCERWPAACYPEWQALRKTLLYHKFLQYAEEQDQLYLHGFVRFRCREEQMSLVETVTAAIDDYLEERQYQEFLELLRCFLETQESMHELVHVVPDPLRQYALYDDQGERIVLDQLDQFFQEGERIHRADDYLVSALLTVAPRRVVFHQFDADCGIVQTVETLFTDRLTYCSTCAHCLLLHDALDVHQPSPL